MPEGPASAHYAVSGAWVCHVGKVRRANEDACLAGTILSADSLDTPAAVHVACGPWIVAVSDGLGGHRGGAEASHTVVSALAGCKRVTPHSITDLLHRLNRHLCERGAKDSELAAMGATIAGLGCGGRGLFAFHIGDSRIFRWENDALVQLTRDDSEAEDLIDLGLLERTADKRPGFLHALTQAIGGRTVAEEIQIHIQPLRVAQCTRFIICSDGLTDMLAAAEIETLVRGERAAAGVVAALFSDPDMGARLYRGHIAPLLKRRGEAIARLTKEGFTPEFVGLATFGLYFAIAMDQAFGSPLGDVAELGPQATNFSLFGFARDMKELHGE